MKTLILGLGNLLLADEGFGVHAARALIEAGCPHHTTVLDIGTAVLDALRPLEEAERVIVLDAVKADKTPGTIYRLPFEEMESSRCIASMHGFDLRRVLALTDRKDLPEVFVIGAEPAEIQWSMELSPVVAEAIPKVVEIVLNEISPRSPLQRLMDIMSE